MLLKGQMKYRATWPRAHHAPLETMSVQPPITHLVHCVFYIWNICSSSCLSSFISYISLTVASILCHGESPIIILGEKECKERGPEFDFELTHTNNMEYVFLALKVMIHSELYI